MVDGSTPKETEEEGEEETADDALWLAALPCTGKLNV